MYVWCVDVGGHDDYSEDAAFIILREFARWVWALTRNNYPFIPRIHLHGKINIYQIFKYKLINKNHNIPNRLVIFSNINGSKCSTSFIRMGWPVLTEFSKFSKNSSSSNDKTIKLFSRSFLIIQFRAYAKNYLIKTIYNELITYK